MIQYKNDLIKAVIFDMDGTLIDTEKLYQIFWAEALSFYGYQPTKELLLNLRSLARNLAEQLLKDTYGVSISYEQIRNKRVELMDQYIAIHGVEKKRGVDGLLQFLRRNNVRMAIATATGEERTKRYLIQLGIYEFFDQIVCAPMVAHGKPAPDIYVEAVKRLNLEPSDCIAIEDSPNGVTSALSAGCHVIMVPEHKEDREVTDSHYLVCESLDRIIYLVG